MLAESIGKYGDLPVAVDDDSRMYDVAGIEHSHADGYEASDETEPYIVIVR